MNAVEARLRLGGCQDDEACGEDSTYLSNLCCTSLAILCEAELCPADQALNLLTSLAEKQPPDLELQMRASAALRRLVEGGAVDGALAWRRAEPLLDEKWLQFISRFQGIDAEGEQLQSHFHVEVQAMFHEEIARQFEYEAADRSLQLQQCNVPGAQRLQEVIRCYVQSLENYQSRVEARTFAWDAEKEQLMPLDAQFRKRLDEEVWRKMEPGLFAALKVAAASAPHSPLRRRRMHLRSECAALLELKTEVTEAHQKRAEQLRREVVLFQALEYLELRLPNVSDMQLRTAFFMFEVVGPTAPADAVALAVFPSTHQLLFALAAPALVGAAAPAAAVVAV